ncbi:MAG: glutamine-hydrolyzing carbamoyl-phosphate synthase small subunit, partial [Chloroflexi bacterium]|nr:glutamine-hydrolyzing carbamoyl-phosphate synthase small subunit [Chloroflexota bacterium]
MRQKALLVLRDGSYYEGYSFGARADGYGEVVFNTSMTGYQEMLTDPSYAGQIVLPTYPLIGNYGTNPNDFESRKIQVSGFVVREHCELPSHYLNNRTLDEYLAASGVPGIWGVDTRAITRKLRSAGVMMGLITGDKSPKEALEKLAGVPDYGGIDFVRQVTAEKAYEWEPGADDLPGLRIVALDCGLKYSILRILRRKGCRVITVPCHTSPDEILALKPDGIVLSPGPGNPELLDYVVGTVRRLVGRKPVMGICLGSQLIGRAFGARTFKLKFGHRGANQPVRNLTTGRVEITSQNHGFAVSTDSLESVGGVPTHVNLHDRTLEGFVHKD